MKNRIEYEEYLKSPEWHSKRMRIAKQRNFTCERCHKVVKNGFHIHHKTYKHFGHEFDNELMFLCEDCHVKIHQQKNNARQKSKKKSTFSCPNCLCKISKSKYLDNFLTNCPHCGYRIGRTSKYGTLDLRQPYEKIGRYF